MTWIQTMDGKVMDLAHPSHRTIDLPTLAIVLSRLCRFGGHSLQFYSVAEHSLRVLHLVAQRTANTRLRLAALLHDAHEAYTGFGDVCRPAKAMCPQIRHLETELDIVIAAKFGIDHTAFHHELVKRADETMLATEARDLMRTPPIPWDSLPDPLEQKIEPVDMRDAAWSFECQARYLVHAIRENADGATQEKQRGLEGTSEAGTGV